MTKDSNLGISDHRMAILGLANQFEDTFLVGALVEIRGTSGPIKGTCFWVEVGLAAERLDGLILCALARSNPPISSRLGFSHLLAFCVLSVRIRTLQIFARVFALRHNSQIASLLKAIC
jgi:hypothetical protein